MVEPTFFFSFLSFSLSATQKQSKKSRFHFHFLLFFENLSRMTKMTSPKLANLYALIRVQRAVVQECARRLFFGTPAPPRKYFVCYDVLCVSGRVL
jgi:hypothetical protein